MAPSVGLVRLEAIHYYVRDLERSRRFYTQKLDFAEVGRSRDDLEGRSHQRALVFEADRCRVVCSSPTAPGGRAHRFLEKHPDGVGSLVFQVADVEKAFRELESRGGTPIADIERFQSAEGSLKTFVMATPFGDTTFRFVERSGAFALYPDFEAYPSPHGGHNAFGFTGFDHVTSNFETMSPALLWMEHVLGFERFWDVSFHTDDVKRADDGKHGDRKHGSDDGERAVDDGKHGEGKRAVDDGKRGAHGSGLRSVVMWDPASGVKFANNEPSRPNFKGSQINVFHEAHRGDGVQHVALGVADILSAVRGMRARGVEFMPTPSAYYDALPERMASLGVGVLEESVSDLRALEILADGDGPGRYLLQVFLKDSAGLYGNVDAGPFFYEIIQRRGDQGFGAGNFRALFESIEREQSGPGRH